MTADWKREREVALQSIQRAFCTHMSSDQRKADHTDTRDRDALGARSGVGGGGGGGGWGQEGSHRATDVNAFMRPTVHLHARVYLNMAASRWPPPPCIDHRPISPSTVQ